ncbi:MAG: peptidylprolyl isomerase [Myxococcota bacterium]
MRPHALAFGVLGTAGALALLPFFGPARAQPGDAPAAPTTAAPTTAAPETEAEGDAAAEPERSPEDVARRSRALATVNGERITVGDVEDTLARQTPFLRARFARPGRLAEMVRDLVQVRLMAAEAERRGYGDNPLVVRQTRQNAVQVLMRTEFDERMRPESVPDEDVRAYFDAHPDEFRREAMVRASSILVATREEAEALLAELREADLATFRQTARDRSIDPYTKLRGGDLRFFARTGLPARANPDDEPVAGPLVEAAFALADGGEVGDLAPEPVAVRDDFAVVKLTGARPAEVTDFERAEGPIRIRLWRERRQEALDIFVRDLRERAAPVLHLERMNAIVLDTEEDHPGLPADAPEPAKAPEPAESPSAPAESPPAPAPAAE